MKTDPLAQQIGDWAVEIVRDTQIAAQQIAEVQKELAVEWVARSVDHQRLIQPAAEDHPIDDRHPQRRRSDEQRDHTGRRVLLRQDDPAIATEQQRRPDEESRSPLGRSQAVPRGAAPTGGQSVQDAAGDEKAQRTHQKWRDGVDGELDAEVGRPPQEIDRA